MTESPLKEMYPAHYAREGLSAHEMRGERPAPALGADGEDLLRKAGLSEQEIRAALGTE